MGMLILSRRKDESIVIDDNVIVTVLSVKGGQVRLGITAPENVSVHREEIQQRIAATLTATATHEAEVPA